MRPTWSSIWKTMLLGNLYMLFVTGVNLLLGSNYVYTLLYLPFAIADRRRRPATVETVASEKA